MKKNKKYITTSIDEASFLALKGHTPHIKLLGTRNAEFIFDGDIKINEHLKMFWSKGALVNIHSWFAVRGNLKKQCATDLLAMKNKTSGNLLGQTYYYIHDGVVQHGIFGKDPVHQERFDSGNFYYKRDEALRKLKQ